jgi:hypothetical protein
MILVSGIKNREPEIPTRFDLEGMLAHGREHSLFSRKASVVCSFSQ